MMSDVIREITQRTIQNDVNATLLYGTVTAKTPLSVKIEDRLTLSGDRLIAPSYLEKKTLQLEERSIELVPEVKTGDRLILINLGERYVIIGKVGDLQNEHILT